PAPPRRVAPCTRRSRRLTAALWRPDARAADSDVHDSKARSRGGTRAFCFLEEMEMPMVDHTDVAAYQGEPGAFSEQGAWNLMGRDAPLLPCRTLGDVFDAVTTGRAGQAVVPFENTLAGTVPRSYELLLEHRLTAVAETCVRVEHMLIAHPRAKAAAIR